MFFAIIILDTPHKKGEMGYEKEYFYVDRIVGGDRHHRNSGGNPAARTRQGPRKGPHHCLRQQPQADRSEQPVLCR